jgi:hypothetical protein
MTAESKSQKFTSHFLLEKACKSMKRKGFVIGTRTEYCGLIEVTWRSINKRGDSDE